MSIMTLKDHLNRTVSFKYPPRRIISLCPSITETLFDLDLEDQIVGRTSFCIHPKEKVKDVKVVGGTKQIKEQVIEQLSPDLIIAEKEENPKEMVAELSEKYPVFVLNVEQYDDAMEMILQLGQLTDREELAQQIVQDIESKFAKLPTITGLRVAYVIWKDPYMVAGNHTFIHAILKKMGLQNVFEHYPSRYPSVSLGDFQNEELDLLFLTSEPYPFKESHVEDLQKLLPNTKVLLVDGEPFIWYGSHMLQGAEYLKALIASIKINKAGI